LIRQPCFYCGLPLVKATQPHKRRRRVASTRRLTHFRVAQKPGHANSARRHEASRRTPGPPCRYRPL